MGGAAERPIFVLKFSKFAVIWSGLYSRKTCYEQKRGKQIERCSKVFERRDTRKTKNQTPWKESLDNGASIDRGKEISEECEVTTPVFALR